MAENWSIYIKVYSAESGLAPHRYHSALSSFNVTHKYKIQIICNQTWLVSGLKLDVLLCIQEVLFWLALIAFSCGPMMEWKMKLKRKSRQKWSEETPNQSGDAPGRACKNCTNSDEAHVCNIVIGILLHVIFSKYFILLGFFCISELRFVLLSAHMELINECSVI